MQSEELCDGDAVGAESCVSQGFMGGVLRCSATCDSFDVAACTTCGNGVSEPGELCDGADLAAQTCADNGFVSGTLGCADTCDAVDTSLCTLCGDEVIDTGEQCDGSALAAETCVSRGFTDGALACSASCTFDLTGCAGDRRLDCCVENDDAPGCIDETVSTCVCAVDANCCSTGWDSLCAGLVETLGCASCVPACGNGRAEAGERCDGNDTRIDDCRSLGFQGGNLRCADGCAAFDTSGCNGDPPTCGDGVREGAEACDGTDLNGLACADFNFASGTLACAVDCVAFDTSACVAPPSTSCGDGLLNGVGELCDGERFALGGPSCADFALGDGDVTCTADCRPDLSACSIGSDLCAALTLYNDGECQPCHLLGGTRDADCEAVCAVDGLCRDVHVAGVWSCLGAGVIDPECGICGDGFRTGAEICDGAVPDDVSCSDFGYASGTIDACTSTCVPDFSRCVTQGDCCSPTPDVPGCTIPGIESCVCGADAFCCDVAWDERCVAFVGDLGCGLCSP